MTAADQENLPQAEIGILGGTGLYKIDGIEDVEEVNLETPFGKPSDAFILGSLEGRGVAFLCRHGRGHRLIPSEINYRANIYGFKMLGVERILSVNSVGSLKEEIKPRDMVVPDQYFDRTRRPNSFFGKGAAAHISFAEPVCVQLAGLLSQVGKDLGLQIHPEGTHICIEGPAFSTKAESHIYRSWGCDVIGMTSATEARLCREAEICYATLNLVTDFDVWHETEETVSVEMILENMQKNIDNAKNILKKTIAILPDRGAYACACQRALKGCIVTQPDLISREAREKLRHIIEKYLGQ
jgi:5'-methylthioadenosine phosphorylase